MVMGGAVMAFQAFVKPSLVKDMVRDGRQQMHGEEAPSRSTAATNREKPSLMSRALDKGLSLVQKGIDTACKDCGIRVYAPEGVNEEVRTSSRVRVLLPPEETGRKKDLYNKKVGNKHYVYKDGKYYQGVENQVYYDKSGTPTLVIDRAQNRYAVNEADEDEDGERAGGVNPKPRARRAGGKDGAFVDSGVPEGLNAYGPGAMKDMVHTVKQAKKNIQEKNKALKILSK